MLAYLRELQRRHGTAVLVVHHAKKGGAVRAGQALRGSSEFHASCRRRASSATGDSNLYLRRTGDDLSLAIEHRAAPSPKPFAIELAQRGDALALEVVDRGIPVDPTPISLDDRIIAVLADADQPIPFAELRALARVRTATLRERIAALCGNGRICRIDGGYRLADR